MSIIDNLRVRGDGDESSGGKFNPFRILEIGESMIRYCDGIRIKNYNFLAILTSDRLVLIESAQQSAGTIAKEIPVSMIQGAVIERDEKNRPALAVSMEVGGQTRLMILVFTGLITEPETECREWFAAINGYSPEPEPEPEQHVQPQAPQVPVPPPVQAPSPETVVQVPAPIIDAEVPLPPPVPAQEVQNVVPEPVPQPPVSEIKEPEQPFIPPVQPLAEVPLPPQSVIPPSIPVQPSPPIATKIPSKAPAPVKQPIIVPTPGSDSILIHVEKPDITSIKIGRKIGSHTSTSGGKPRFCIHCGSKISLYARFCPVCGKSQV